MRLRELCDAIHKVYRDDNVAKAQKETGLPATDPVRFESGPLVDAIVRAALS